jgi:hypothetical protein
VSSSGYARQRFSGLGFDPVVVLAAEAEPTAISSRVSAAAQIAATSAHDSRGRSKDDAEVLPQTCTTSLRRTDFMARKFDAPL